MATERCRTVSRLIVLLIVGLSIVPRVFRQRRSTAVTS